MKLTETFPLPDFLKARVEHADYVDWLSKKANAHAKRDKKREHTNPIVSEYRQAIHEAVIACEGKDVYTGEELEWEKMGKYRNEDSAAGTHKYKAGFALLPTIDHVEASSKTAPFKICGWRTNDAKHDLNIEEFLALCVKVLKHEGYTVSK